VRDMQVSFGKFVPVKSVYLYDRDAKTELRTDIPEERDVRDDVTNVFCRVLRNDDCIQKYWNYEQIRRHFSGLVTDYQYPNSEIGRTSKVMPVNISKLGRFIVTGKDVASVRKLDRELGHNKKLLTEQEKTSVEEGLLDEAEAYERAETRAKEYRQNKLYELAMKKGKLSKYDLHLIASKEQGQDTIKDTYVIRLMDLKA